MMRVAYFSPLPPARSGIADYSEALLESLRPLASVGVFAAPDQPFDPARFDIALYQVGNNGFHTFVYEAALRHPGVVAMHESNLHHLIAEMTIRRGDWDAYVRECEYDGGPAARAFAEHVRKLEVGPDYEGVTMTRRLLERARGVIVHSRFMESEIRAAGFTGPIAVIPHGAWIPRADRHAYRDRLGLEVDAPLIGIFGYLKPYKRIAESLRAFRRLVKVEPRARMILVGEPHPELPVGQMIGSLGLSASVRVLGFAPIDEFTGYMAACDIVLNLRCPTVGESSGTMLRAMGLGKAVLVSEIGSFAEFPEDVCLRVAVGACEEDLIFEYLNLLVSRPEVARELGARARRYVAERCNWAAVARQYAEFLESVAQGREWEPRALEESGESPASPPAAPAGPEAGAGTGPEAGAETGPEAGAGTGPEASAATGPEASAATGPEASAETGPEASAETGPEAGAETGPEASAETGPEAGADAGPRPQTGELARYLLGWAATPEAKLYLATHTTRSVRTLEITPPGGPADRILEMGAYLQITPALHTRLGYGEVRGCYFGPLGRTDHREVTSADGETFACDIDHFDAEKDVFPYPGEYFSTVVCGELIEHLFEDPMHMMSEVNRILKPGGHLVLTTPNIASLRGISAILQGYHPGFFHAYLKPAESGEGDARHNREYVPREIQQLLEGSGFAVALLETGEFRDAPHPEFAWVLHLLRRYRLDTELRGDGIYAVGRKTGPVTNRYPVWLYQ